MIKELPIYEYMFNGIFVPELSEAKNWPKNILKCDFDWWLSNGVFGDANFVNKNGEIKELYSLYSVNRGLMNNASVVCFVRPVIEVIFDYLDIETIKGKYKINLYDKVKLACLPNDEFYFVEYCGEPGFLLADDCLAETKFKDRRTPIDEWVKYIKGNQKKYIVQVSIKSADDTKADEFVTAFASDDFDEITAQADFYLLKDYKLMFMNTKNRRLEYLTKKDVFG